MRHDLAIKNKSGFEIFGCKDRSEEKCRIRSNSP
jgi:hypothetical protein